MLRESLNAMLQSSSHWPDQCQAVLCMCCAALCTRVVSMSVPCYACALILPTPLIEYTSTSTVSASLPALFLNVASVFCSFGITLGSISIQWTGAPHPPFSAHRVAFQSNPNLCQLSLMEMLHLLIAISTLTASSFRMAALLLFLSLVSVGGHALQTNEPGLPEDTFRRLAAVLYSRGDKEENRLTRKFLYNRNVTCNDGTPAGYYIRRNPSSRKWVLFLEGGWYCYDQVSCEARWLRLRTLMSSSQWPEEKTVGGIMSSDHNENPHFAEANHVLLPYCSSDSWAGTARSSKDQQFSFMGADIMQEVVRELFSWEQLAAGTELYLAGSSAGGTGVLINLDPVAELVRTLGSRMRVRGIVDSGWFLDNDPFSASTKVARSPSATVAQGTQLWRARVPDSCAQAFPGEQWKCFFGYRIYPTMTSKCSPDLD